ncbi:MAG: Hsp70 family protein, partial [Pseudoclavibacter sp.]
MRIGIDFGTTRTVVATADRGNYPVVAFDDHDGDAIDYLPTVAAETADGIRYGFNAVAAHRSGAPLLRSFKRHLADPGVSFDDVVRVGGTAIPLVDLVAGFAASLERGIRTASNVAAVVGDEPLQAVLGVPAHAPSGQRMLTLEAFSRAGFEVLGMMNEPSAAAFEYTHRYPKSITSRRNDVIVFDLGGGTFDASLVRVDGLDHRILTSVGDPRLGGDDFDEVLATAAMRAACRSGDPSAALVDDARAVKEQIVPQTRRVTVDVDGEAATVALDDYYRASGPLVDRALDVMEPLLAGDGLDTTSDA